NESDDSRDQVAGGRFTHPAVWYNGDIGSEDEGQQSSPHSNSNNPPNINCSVDLSTKKRAAMMTTVTSAPVKRAIVLIDIPATSRMVPYRRVEDDGSALQRGRATYKYL